MAILEWDKEKNIKNNKTIIFLFRRGLKKNIRNKLIYNKIKINNFIILIKRVIAINNKLYFRAIKKNSKKTCKVILDIHLTLDFMGEFYPIYKKISWNLITFKYQRRKRKKKKVETGNLYSIITYIKSPAT